MIWHILKKDLRLLWPMAMPVGLLQFLVAGLLSSHSQFERGASGYGNLGWVSNNALPIVSLLGLAILTVAVVQQDRLSGVTQDWLTRPISRGELIAAKMAFILAVGLGPILLADIASGVLERLPLAPVVAASLTRTLVLYGVVCVPTFLIGVVTQSLTEALVFTLAILVALGLEMVVLAQMELQAPLSTSGFSWTILPIFLTINLLALALLLPLQLRWRATNRVRWLAAAYVCVTPGVIFLPWKAGFGLHQAIASGHAPVAFSVRADSTRKMTFAAVKTGIPSINHRDQVHLTLPVTVSPSTPDQAWQLDYASIRLIDPATGASLGSAQAHLIRGSNSRPNSSISLLAALPEGLFHQAQARKAMISSALFITTFRLESTKRIAEVANTSIDEYSRCRRGYGETVRCVSTQPVGECIADEYSESHRRRSLPGTICPRATYAPWPLPLWRDAYFTFNVPAQYSMLPESPWGGMLQAPGQDDGLSHILRNYVPDTHLMRTADFELNEAVLSSEERKTSSRDGTGVSARFAAPTGMAADSHGNLFIVDQVDSIVRKMTPAGVVTTFAGVAGRTGHSDGQGSDALFSSPGAIAVDSKDNLYVADTANALVRKISPSGVVTTMAGAPSSPDPEAKSLRLRHPTGVVCGRDESLYVIDHDEDNNAVVIEVLPGGALKQIAGPDSGSMPDFQEE